ncbi:hypothetical protein SAMN05660464_3846 [Geodermatophilus dictyosporus]|uniref:Peptidoglycan lipid II flippase n=1 Tax=Geodermatophilus dictyosporus TaxID=1523247 RepID=A0A1I5S870_9ACTN|nr:hypothetical protein [Geodermatophilus dictyosporus]SFP66891.1 hypothetical protein SAMN05660464_3846 [Geodermatophilus dictyosporus]
MTSTITGLPDRYRPLDELGPVERTQTGVIHSWRAKDRVLNRDVAVRVHVPGGPPARAWIARALTAGGLATPALAMVYDASEGTGGQAGSPAYVVNEWIDGQTLADRLASGPMGEREARTVLRRLAEGVAEAHRVGLAVGGLGPETVVLRPNGLVGLRAVPAATGSVQEDISALGALLEFCLTGRQAGTSGAPPVIGAPDLAALVRRARSTEPGSRLASAAAMAALLAERPRAGARPVRGGDESDSGWLGRLREHRETERVAGAHRAPAPVPEEDDDRPQRVSAGVLPPVPSGRWTDEESPHDDLVHDDLLHDDGAPDDEDPAEDRAGSPTRRRLLVVGLPLLALLLVIALAYWVGTSVLSVADEEVDRVPGAAPPAPSTSPAAETAAAPAPDAAPAAITGGTVLDPFGDGEPENVDDVPASFDGDPATAWSTLTYRGSADFGNLKPGVGVVYDLGSAQPVAGVTLTTSTPGITVEVRTGDSPDGDLESYAVAAGGTVEGTGELAFEEPVTTQYVVVWVTGLVPADDGFQGSLAEVAVTPAT